MDFIEWLKYRESSIHPDQHAFHLAIDENPEDQTRWLIYADWLEERGETKLADYIRHFFNKKDKLQDYYAAEKKGIPSPEFEKAADIYNAAHRAQQKSHVALGGDVHNLPIMLDKDQNSNLINIYGNPAGGGRVVSRFLEKNKDWQKLKTSHIGFRIRNFYDPELYINFYLNKNSDLLKKRITIRGHSDSQRHNDAINRDLSEPLDTSIPVMVDDKTEVPVSVQVEGDNSRTYKFKPYLGQDEVIVPFSTDPEKGYGRVYLEPVTT